MSKILLTIAMFALRLPDVDTMRDTDWQPDFTDTEDIQLTESTVAILTHCSQRFDPQRQTFAAIDRVVARMKAESFPVLYLHDRYNPSNPAWSYLYSDWSPTAYVHSDIGHLDLNLKHVKHVVCLGGFFEQCERSTVTDVVRMWKRDGFDHDLRVTQVMDGVFTVASYLKSQDTYEQRVRSFYHRQLPIHRKSILTLEQITRRIPFEELLPDFLKRQIPAVPADANVVMDIYGVIYRLQLVSPEAPTLVFSYRQSNSVLQYRDPEINFDNPLKKWNPPTRYRSSPVPSRRIVYGNPVPVGNRVVSGNTAISSGSYAPITSTSAGRVISYGPPISSGTVISSGTIISSGTAYPSVITYPSGSVISSGTSGTYSSGRVISPSRPIYSSQ